MCAEVTQLGEKAMHFIDDVPPPPARQANRCVNHMRVKSRVTNFQNKSHRC